MPEPDFVYRLITKDELAMISQSGQLPLRPVDEKDGYIHLSCFEQLLETADLHMSDDEVFALAFKPAILGEAFGWHHAAKRGADFPHVTGDLLLNKADHRLHLSRSAGHFVVKGKN